MTAPSASRKRGYLVQRAHRDATRFFGEDEPQVPHCFFRGARCVGKRAAVFRGRGGFQDDVAREREQLNRGEALTEEERGRLRDLMRFIQDDGVACGQDLAYAFVAQHDVREEEMMIHDHDVGGERLLARVHDEAAVVMAAFRAETVLACRGDLRPHGRGLGDAGAVCAIARRARARETLDRMEVSDIVAIQEPTIRDRALEMMMTDVVCAALEQSDRHGNLQRVPHLRNIAVEKLVLERLRARGDDDLPAGAQRGHEVREGLAGAGPCFRDEHRALRDCGGDRACQIELAGSHAKALDYARERAVCRENRVEVGHGRHLKGKPVYSRRFSTPECRCSADRNLLHRGATRHSDCLLQSRPHVLPNLGKSPPVQIDGGTGPVLAT